MACNSNTSEIITFTVNNYSVNCFHKNIGEENTDILSLISVEEIQIVLNSLDLDEIKSLA